MALVTFQEIIDLFIMVFVIGFIFKDVFQVRVSNKEHDPLEQYKKKNDFFSEGFKTAVIVTAPAIVLHEAAHKITAIMFGLQATFHAAYMWLGIGLFLKLLSFPFIFFVPGFVSYTGGPVEPLVRAFIALAGPLVNLLLFLFATLALKQNWFNNKYQPLLVVTKQINLFLFIFNMIPFGFFDGAHVFRNLIEAF